MTALRILADCNAAGQVCVGTAELSQTSQPCVPQLTKENWLLGTDNNAANKGLEMD